MKPEPEPPGYVKTLDKFGIPGYEKVDWLEFGLMNRTRFEMHDDDYRRGRDKTLPEENQFLMRNQTYVGIRRIFDPLRFGIEVADARQFMSNFPDVVDDEGAFDLVQGFGELYFADALGAGYPVQFRAGRMTLDYLDRRLLARYGWRNTINTYDGFRLRLGDPKSDWQFDFFAVQPDERRMTSPDVPDEERWYYAAIGSWRKWSPWVILEPYYIILDEDLKSPELRDRTLHSMGLYTYGLIGKTGFDYDLDVTFQYGRDGSRDIRAFAYHNELGYLFNTPWKPRLSLATAYASGDRTRNDGVSERFDRLQELGHAFSASDIIDSRNIIKEQLRLTVNPSDKMRVSGAYGGYWLAVDSDAWAKTGRYDPTGRSGDFVGQEVDLTWRWQFSPHMDIEVGYIAFLPGNFVRNTGPADDSDFFYVQTCIQL